MNVRFCVWLCLTAAATAVAGAAWPQQEITPQQGVPRVALIIANANYPEAGTPLPTIIKDAGALADEFRHNNFNVDLKENVGKDDMDRAFAAFTRKISRGAVALFYFGGFGIQVAHQNYLIPVDAQISSEADVQHAGISLDAILSEMERKGARVKIVIVDAARQNPFERRFRPSYTGLAALDAPDGTLALYSQLPGKVINDSKGENGLFVSELIKEFRIPNLSAEEVFNAMRMGVSRASKNEQVPWVSSTLVGKFAFATVAGAALQTSAAVTPAPPAPMVPPAPAPRPLAPAPPVYKAGDFFRDCSDCGELVVLPAGQFEMGSRENFEGPTHRVTIAKPFAIGRREVTFQEWDQCIATGGCKYRPDDHGWGRGYRPVIDISWLDAKDFLKWMSDKTGQTYRLPSEAEWEYAARAGKSTPYWWGADVGPGQANCRDCGTGGTQTTPVGTFNANPFGLFDTAGNAAEWVEDCWNDNYRSAPLDGSAWTAGQCQLRVLRGGAFNSNSIYLRSPARFRYDYDVRYLANGFRVVREIH
jgi:formylglycine-generating enzyme required for sulfatase activity